jgi:hypothetical protein
MNKFNYLKKINLPYQMGNMKYIIILFMFSLLMISCEKDENSCVPVPENNNGPCIDSLLMDSTSACFDLYDPVCGCDGVTYGNSCYATIFGGVSSYVSGECCD